MPLELLNFLSELADDVMLQLVPADHTCNPRDGPREFLVGEQCQLIVNLCSQALSDLTQMDVLDILSLLYAHLIEVQNLLQVKVALKILLVLVLIL